MENNLTADQIEKIRNDRKQRFQGLGLPSNAGQIGQITEVTATTGGGGVNQSAHQVLQNIKRGAKK